MTHYGPHDRAVGSCECPDCSDDEEEADPEEVSPDDE